MARYLVGIDLGTTNSALAYVDLTKKVHAGRPELTHFPIPQLVAAGEVKERPLLPSFLYLPGEHELPPGAAKLPWHTDEDNPSSSTLIVGEFARVQGSRVPGRLATSAKSWLCHPGVDRTAGLLPWSAPPEVARLSPVDVSAAYLRHMVEAWNATMAKDREADRLENLPVVLTVPASFDDVARTLTVEAAQKAGLKNVVLLEEPQAAFYCWLACSPQEEIGALKPGARCVVVDVGGGTSDFSLIEAVEQQGEMGFVRQSVGDHLLLGGDNMDLALAKFVETKLPQAGRLDAAQYALLTQSCRSAKEILLAPNPPEHHSVTVIGRGRAVIGGMLHTHLTPEEVRKVIFEGFFPAVPRDAQPQRGARGGLHEMGLPYVSDPAITRHLASFVHGQSSGERDDTPTAILFNGGVFQPASLREHMLGIMKQWYGQPGQPWQPLVMTTPSLDLAVALGAAYFGWLRHTGGKRIGGGIARSYYVGIAADTPPTPREGEAASDSSRSTFHVPRSTVLCVAPQHLEEEQEIELKEPELELALGQPVLFPLYSSTVRSDDRAGDVLQVDPERLLQLPPLHTVLRGGKRSGTRSVPVTLAARITPIGTLEVFCVAKEGNNRWRLEFNIRELVQEAPSRGESGDGDGEPTLQDIWIESQVQDAARLIRACFGEPQPPDAPSPQELIRLLETALEAKREEWPTGLCRRLWDFLSEVIQGRTISPPHQSRWYNLVGWSLRPGFGDPMDKFRVEQLWKQLLAPPRDKKQLPDGGAHYWIMWRRVAGGLNASYQQSLFDRLRPTLLSSKGKGGGKVNANELAEMWRAAASLERLDVRHKEALANVLLPTLERSPAPTYGFWSLTRLGARSLIYGPLNAVVHHQLAERWLDAILGFEPSNVSEHHAWAFCVAQLARRTGQRALDVDDSHRKSVLLALRKEDVPDHWLRMVEEVVLLDREEQGEMLGDALPIGLRLRG